MTALQNMVFLKPKDEKFSLAFYKWNGTTQHSQLATTSSSPRRLCQLTTTKSPLDNAMWPSCSGDNLLQVTGRRAGQAGDSSGSLVRRRVWKWDLPGCCCLPATPTTTEWPTYHHRHMACGRCENGTPPAVASPTIKPAEFQIAQCLAQQQQ